eukprot:2970-Heterococcus_DN1.PRE.1
MSIERVHILLQLVSISSTSISSRQYCHVQTALRRLRCDMKRTQCTPDTMAYTRKLVAHVKHAKAEFVSITRLLNLIVLLLCISGYRQLILALPIA